MSSLVEETITRRRVVAKFSNESELPTIKIFGELGLNGNVCFTSINTEPTEVKNLKSGRFKRASLGCGAFSTAYLATKIILSPFESSYQIRPDVVVLRTKSEKFDMTPFNYLQEISQCAQLQAIPESFYPAQKKYSYMIMPLLPEKKDLMTLINENIDDAKKSWELMISGCKNTAIAAAHLHREGFVHTDIKLENMTSSGLFDYGSLGRKDDFLPWHGASLDQCPPEVILQFYKYRCLDEAVSSPLIKTFSDWYGIDALNSLYLELLDERPEIRYTEAIDVFLLGRQFIRLVGETHPSTWGVTTEEWFDRFIPHLSRMLSLKPADRPTMEECIRFFEEAEINFRGTP
jgi:serine/threonine protein kinase